MKMKIEYEQKLEDRRLICDEEMKAFDAFDNN